MTKTKKVFDFTNNLKHFLSKEIWSINLNKIENPVKRFLYSQLRAFMIVGRGFSEDRLAIRSGNLTYISAFSLIPVLMMGIWFATVIIGAAQVETVIRQQGHQLGDFFQPLIEYAMLVVNNAGTIGPVGFIVLLIMMIGAFNNIEQTFNMVWGVHEHRKIYRKMTDYLFISLILPMLFFAALYLMTIVQQAGNIDENIAGTLGKEGLTFVELLGKSFILRKIMSVISYAIVWLVLLLFYLIMPNTNVKFAPAFTSSIIAGTLLLIVYEFVTHFAFGRTAGGEHPVLSLFGPFAIIPLSLLFINYVWMVILIGVELSFAYQNLHTYRQERAIEHASTGAQVRLGLACLIAISQRFHAGEEPYTAMELSERFNVPTRTLNAVLHILTEHKLLSFIAQPNNAYLPLKDFSTFTINDVEQVITWWGDFDPAVSDSKIRLHITKVYQKIIAGAKKAGGNISIKQLAESLK